MYSKLGLIVTGALIVGVLLTWWAGLAIGLIALQLVFDR